MNAKLPAGYERATGVNESIVTCQNEKCGRTYRQAYQSKANRCPYCGAKQEAGAADPPPPA